MQQEPRGFWRTSGVLLTIALLVLFAWSLPGRWQDVMDLVSGPRMPASLPPDAPGRARVAAEIAASAVPNEENLATLWRLVGDPNDFVRGQALEALALSHEGARADPRKLDRLRQIAADDTDWNRRSACVMLIQADAAAALPLAEPLYTKTTNANTRAALLAAFKEQDGAPLRSAMVRARSTLLPDLTRKP